MTCKKLLLLAAVLVAACAGPVEQDSGMVLATGRLSARAPVYLALGDSVAFGWSDALARITDNPHRFVGYPQFLAEALDLPLLDAACPSEATGSFISPDLPDDGCRAYRADHPLHVSYEGTQLEYALGVAAAHGRLELVTLQLGADDLQLLRKGCSAEPDPSACLQAGLPGTVQTAAQRVAFAVLQLREAGYLGEILLLDYYNPGTDLVTGLALGALDAALASAARATGVTFVDLCLPFNGVNPLDPPPPGLPVTPCLGRDPCAEGLIATVDGACEIHPSRAGHRLIASVAAEAVDGPHCRGGPPGRAQR